MKRVESELVREGAGIFKQNCLTCHNVDSNDSKFGSGLKGLFDMERLPSSQLPVDVENVKKQIRAPYGKMPAFEQMGEEDIEALIAYMKTL